ADALAKFLVGKAVLSISIQDCRHSKDLEKFPTPATIHSVSAYGKRPIITTEYGHLVTFLCMNGRWLFAPHSNTRIILDIGTYEFKYGMFIINKEFSIYFDDSRNLGVGYVEWLNDLTLLEYKLNVGPDLILDCCPKEFV